MNKVSFTNSLNKTLIGNLWQAPSDTIIIMAHGSGSNKSARGLFEPLAHAFQEHNYNVLTFDFSGHGESDDDILTIEKSVDDLRSAIHYAKAQGYKRFAFFGHSLGALSCLLLHAPEVETMVLLGPVAGPVFWKWEDMCTPEQLQEVKEKGYISEVVNDGLRAVIKHDGNLLNELAALNQKELLENVHCPLLIIHGDGDAQERDMLATTQKGVIYLPKNSKLQIIPGAKHSFITNSKEVTALALAWYQQQFKVP